MNTLMTTALVYPGAPTPGEGRRNLSLAEQENPSMTQPVDQDQEAQLVRCERCGRYGWHDTDRCPEQGRQELPEPEFSASRPVDLDPVDSATRACCGGIGAHVEPCPETCEPWCPDDGHLSNDRACWGDDHNTHLTMEEGYPHGALPDQVGRFDPPRIGVNAYRRQPGWRSCVYLHVYRPHDIGHLDLDENLQLTVDEARQLAAHLVAVADEIGGAR